MYNNIEILETDFESKFLLRYGNKSLYVGVIIKYIVELLQLGKTEQEIVDSVYQKHQVNIGLPELNKIITEKLTPFLNRKETKSFHRILPLFNPSKLHISKILLLVFNPTIFYPLFGTFVLLNLYFLSFGISLTTLSLPENLVFYFLLFMLLIFHEIGHALGARRYELKAKEIGLGAYYFLPVFYIDLNEAWKLEPKKRIIINLSGIFFQLFMGVLIFLIQFSFPQIQSLLFNLFLVNLTIVFINVNPFLKFDGYWVISDLLQQHNLAKTADEIIAKFLHFKSSKAKPLLILYSVLRLAFILWLCFMLLKAGYKTIQKLIAGMHPNWLEYVPLIISIVMIGKLLFTFLKKQK